VAAQTTQIAPQQNNRGKRAEGRMGTVFTVPAQNYLWWAAEIPDRVEGITEEDSYLFITSDESPISDNKKKKYRAFIVPKSDPSKQYEISATNGEDDMGRAEFRIDLGQGHQFVGGATSSAFMATLDGKKIRHIDNANIAGSEIHDLVKQGKSRASWIGDNGEINICLTGDDTWIITTKDWKTGRIERFTQSGTSGLGRLDVIQGDTVSKLGYDKPFFTKEEANSSKTISSRDGVPLPDSMRYHAESLIQDIQATNNPNATGLEALNQVGHPDSLGLQALKNLVNTPDRAEVKQKETDGAAKVNTDEKRKQAQQPTGRTFPVP
jgi:hypothetical protein